MPRPGVFLDRDGTINEERAYLSSMAQFRFIDGAARAVRLLKESGLKVVVVTNQAGVARGHFSEETVGHIHCTMERMLRAQGAHIDAVYYCPHHPTEGVGLYRIECNCRKPKPGMLERAARELGIDLSKSWVVGDKISDLEAGHAVGCRIVLVRTGYGLESEEMLAHLEFRPDYIANDVLDASQWILRQRIRPGPA